MKRKSTKAVFIRDSKRARKGVEEGRIIPQEEVYRGLGLSFLEKEPNVYSIEDLKQRYKR